MNQDQITAKLSQIQSKGLESTFSLSEAALENAEKLAALNYAASKDVLVNAQDSFQAVLTAKDPKQVTEMMSVDALQEVSDQASDYQRKVTQLLRDSNKEFVNVVDASIDEIQADMNAVINQPGVPQELQDQWKNVQNSPEVQADVDQAEANSDSMANE